MYALRRSTLPMTRRLVRNFQVTQDTQKIKEIVSAQKQTHVIGAALNDNLENITKLLQQYKVGALPVFNVKESGILPESEAKILQVEGIISERDVIRDLALSDLPLKEITVQASMTPKSRLIVVSGNSTAAEGIELMLAKNIRHLVVLDNVAWNFAGLVSIKDVIHGLYYADEVSKKAKEAFVARSVGMAASW